LKIVNEGKTRPLHIASPAILCSHIGNRQKLGFTKLETLTVWLYPKFGIAHAMLLK